MTEKTHNLLKRQLRRFFGESYAVPPEWAGFIEAVNNAYFDSDEDRSMMERSLELSSQELLRANSELRAVFEALPDLFFRIDHNGTILDFKAGNAEDLFLEPEKILCKIVYQMPVKDIGDKFRDAIQEVSRTSSVVVFEYSMSALDSEKENHYEARILPALENQYIAVVRNVTNRKQAEASLRESEKKYRSIFENAVEGIFQTTTDGTYISINPSLARMCGYDTPEDLLKNITNIGKYQYVAPEDRLRYMEIIERDGLVRGFETQLFRKDKTKIWVSLDARAVTDENGNIVMYEGTIDNITDRKKIEADLFESEEKYRSIVEESHFGVYIIQRGLFRYVNKRFCEMHGYSYEEIVDKMGPKDFLVLEDLKVVEESMKKRIGGDIKSDELYYSTIRKDGGILPMKAIGSCVTYKGKPAIIGTLLDLSKEKVLEMQLLQAQKLETVGRLAGGIAHDFNNILGVILGNTELAKVQLAPECRTFEYLSTIEKATLKAAEFVKQLLAFSRQQVLKLKVIDLGKTITGFENMMRRVISEHILMRIAVEPDIQKIKADSAQLNQVILNLVVNARQAMEGGGQLSLTVGQESVDEIYCIGHHEAKPGDYVTLTVADTGPGIPKDIIDKIYEPFFTTKADGNGLGLSVVYGIVKQHGGFVTVYSEPGKGTAFKIHLPAISEKRIAAEEKERAAQGGDETILIVEDDSEVRHIASEILKSLGYSVFEAPDGEEGLEIFTEKKDIIDLVILDVVMPKMGGMETFEAMKKEKPSIRSLFMTGYSLNGLHMDFASNRDIHVIQKPYTFNSLANKIREILELPESA